MTFIHIIFIGHHKERLLNSIKFWATKYPPASFILITGEPETTGERKAQLIAEEMRKELSTPIYNVTIQKINKLDAICAVQQLIEVITAERNMNQEILLNISGSLRIFAVIGYISACITQSKLVSAIPQYDDMGNEIDIERHIEIPVLPFSPLGEEHLKVLSAIGSGVESVEDLVCKLHKCEKNTPQYNSERARMSYYLESLEKAGLIIRVKDGRMVQIRPTDLGKIYSPNMKTPILIEQG